MIVRTKLLRRVVLAALVCAPVPALSQETAPLVLRLSPSVRAVGFGDAYVAGRGSEVVFFNPAQVGGFGSGTYISLSRFAGSDATLAAFATSVSVLGVTWGIGLQGLDYGSEPGVFPSPIYTVVDRQAIVSRSMAATLAGAFRFKGFRVGVSAKYVEEFVPPLRAGAPAFDVGLGRDLGRFNLGIVAQNIGPDLERGDEEAELPTRVALGAATGGPLSTFFDFAVTAAVGRERNGRITPAGGAEVSYVPIEGYTFTIRAGARRPEEAPDGRGRKPWTLGGSVGIDRIAFDYAFEPFRGSGAGHRFGLRVN